jgi:hypothetical protein
MKKKLANEDTIEKIFTSETLPLGLNDDVYQVSLS